MRGFNNGPVMDQVKPPDNLHDSLKCYRSVRKKRVLPFIKRSQNRATAQRQSFSIREYSLCLCPRQRTLLGMVNRLQCHYRFAYHTAFTGNHNVHFARSTTGFQN